MNNQYYAILGINPSKGARSPKLWNKVFKKLKIKSKMICIDLKPNQFNQKINFLFKDKNFKGGAITNPYKEKIFKKLKKENIEKSAINCKSLNLIVRKGLKKENIEKSAINCKSLNLIVRKGLKFKGFNTDGEAALNFLKNKEKGIKNNKILVLGFGGAGKAICSYINSYCRKKIYVSTRLNRFQKRIKKLGYIYIPWKDIGKNIQKFDTIINCTSVGHRSAKTPINRKIIEKCYNKVFFDIIYQPKKTTLLKIAKKNGNKIYNGLEMNLLQAAISFSKANNYKNLNEIRNIMKK